jgi:hypothetical protein
MFRRMCFSNNGSVSKRDIRLQTRAGLRPAPTENSARRITLVRKTSCELRFWARLLAFLAD